MKSSWDFVKKHKHAIAPQIREIQDLEKWLIESYDASRVEPSSWYYPDSYINALPINAFNALSNMHLEDDVIPTMDTVKHIFQPSEFVFRIYDIPETAKTERYYKSRPTIDKLNRPIYVVIEEKTGYIESNCALLFLEVFLYRGISEFDYDHNTFRLAAYCSFYDDYHCGKVY